MSQNPDIPLSILDHSPWGADPIWPASAITLRRNLAHYKFPSKLENHETKQVLETLKNELVQLPELENPHFLEKLESGDQDLILEHFLFLKGFERPADGHGVVVNQKGNFLAAINTINHLEMRALHLSGSLQESWNLLMKIESDIGKSSPFAFSPRFGYLTSDPAQSGTGLSIQAFLHLPALIHANQLPTALMNCEGEELKFMGLSGDLNELAGDIVIVQNNVSLGLSEEAILHAITTSTSKLIGAEKTLRSHLKNDGEIKDLISKAFGLLVHSYQLETKESLDWLSLMKLGLDLGFVQNVEDRKLSELFFKCRRGHLLAHFPELKDSKEISHKRAEFLKAQLQGISLSPQLD